MGIRVIWAAALALVVPAGGQAAPLTLADAVQYAIGHSPTLDSALRAASIADLQYRNTTAAFLPSLDLTSTHGVKRTKVTNQPLADNPWTSDLNVALTETLYDNGVSLTKHRIAELALDAARIDFEGARARLARDVAIDFYKYSLAVKLGQVAQERAKILSGQFAKVSSAYRYGLKTRQDFLRFKTQVQRADIDRVSAESDVRSSVEALRKDLGVPLAP
ncbi:MAG: TolC family protein, partial [Deltaproteobacteria bacterium]|nr:TolC family protein [Deltaproteobacteria bacterium]